MKKKPRVLITGGRGLLGANILKHLSKQNNYKLVSIGRTTINSKSCFNVICDITERDSVLDLDTLKPDLIIHCAAMTNISYCEQHPDAAYQTNALGSEHIAQLAKKVNAKLIYISTDAVFDGLKGNYTETDQPNPVHAYGKTKLQGEQAASQTHENIIVIRTNLFGKNLFNNNLSFIETILKNLSQDIEYHAFYDVIFNPLYVINLIEYIMKLYHLDAKGIYHIGSSEVMSRYDFARLVAKVFNYRSDLIQKNSVESLFPKDGIRRTKNCSLSINKFLATVGVLGIPTMEAMLNDLKSSW